MHARLQFQKTYIWGQCHKAVLEFQNFKTSRLQFMSFYYKMYTCDYIL